MPGDAMHPLDFYSRPGSLTDPDPYSDLFSDLPASLAELCQVVQNNLVHVFWAERYGRSLSDSDKAALNLRALSAKLALIRQINPRPLAAVRQLEQRQAGNCRDFSLLLTAMLRHQGRPARARCGFGTYFEPDHYEDHWVCEYWNTDQQRWVFVDAQLDDLQRKTLGISFDPLEVPRDQFILAGQAWQMCRHSHASPEKFGIFDMHGWWFIWGNVVRDFLSLNKIEILPWDYYEGGYFTHRLEDPLPADPHELEFYDQIAALTISGDMGFQQLREMHETDSCWHVPEGWLKNQKVRASS